MYMDPSHTSHSVVEIVEVSQDTGGKDNKMQVKELRNRVRAFTGAFIVMISPVLLAIVLKKVNLTGAGKYRGIRMLEVLVGLVQTRFPHLAAVTLLMGILPFLCVMASEACYSLPPLNYVAPRLKAGTKVLLFVANVLLMLLGCGILLLLHKNALLVIIFCSTMAIGAMVVNIIVIRIGYSCDRGTAEDITAENHSELEHLLEFSAGVTVMMFLVLECVVLEGLLRNSQGQAVFLGSAQPPAPTPSATQQGQETFLGSTLLISFFTTAFGVSLMNVWTVFGTAPRPWTPPSEPEPEAGAANCGSESVGEMGSASSSKHAEAPMEEPQPKRRQTSPKSKSKTVTLTATLPWCLNFILHAVPVAAVLVLITLEVLPHKLKPAVWLPFFPPATVLLMLLARCSCEEDSSNKEEQGQAGPRGEQAEIQMAPPEQTGGSGSASSNPGKAQEPEDKEKEPEDEKQPADKPAPLELTKVAFTGFLAMAVPNVTNASVGNPSIVFVLSTAATVLMSLLWRLLTTHEAEAEPPSYVLKAANHASFGAHLCILIAGVAFWVMAVNV